MLELLPRHSTGLATEILDAFPALVIQGARQVGKSTFAGQLTQGRPARIVTLDDEATFGAAASDGAAFVEQFPEGTLVIDELQRLPHLLLALKASIDRDRRASRFVLTGSSNLLRLPRTPESLAGRAATIELSPLSQGEITAHNGDLATKLRSGVDAAVFSTTWTRIDYATAIARGGYPEARKLSPRLRNVWFDSYIQRLLERDLGDIAPRVEPSRVAAILRLVAASQAGELVKARIARDAGIPESSATAYLDLLETMYLTRRVAPWTPNLTSREVARPKVIVNDSGLALRLARLTEQQLIPLGNAWMGPAMEGFVMGELLKQQPLATEEHEIFHFRDRDGLEVDAVIEFHDGSVIGLEIKSGSTTKGDHFKGLIALRDRLGDRFLGGYVLNTAAHGSFFGDRLAALPVSAIWEL